MTCSAKWRSARTACLALLSCAHSGDYSARPQAEARGFYYTDEAGLSVSTVGAQGAADVAPSLRVNVQALVDRVVLIPPTPAQPKPPGPGQPSGHYDPGVDIISSASVNAANETTKTEKWRYEGIARGTWSNQDTAKPAHVGLLARASTEPDYKSVYSRLMGDIELFERNTTLSGFFGYGHDRVVPPQPPPGQESLWPAHHDRINGGATVSQILGDKLIGSLGLAFTHQWGTLSSPYRRALVLTTLFPEVVPQTRERLTAFAALSYYLGGDSAVHLRQGFYADSWGVLALVPEAALAKELGSDGLVSFRYRYYAQGRADFYRPVYPEILSVMSGDPRLGELREHLAGVEIRWALLGRLGWSNSLTAIGGYELSMLRYRQLHSTVRAQVFSLGLTWGY